MSTPQETEQAAAILFRALLEYVPMANYQFFYRNHAADSTSGCTPGNCGEPPAYDKAKYRNRVLEDDGDKARAAKRQVVDLLGWEWARQQIEAVYGEDYFTKGRDDEEEDDDE